jgi:glycosyltransferase involved in cell wall biosynthesis
MAKFPELLIVTPAKNEANNIKQLHAMLELQKVRNFKWVLVIDGSEDNSFEIASKLTPSFPFDVINYESSGLLIKGGAFQTWNYGVDFGLKKYPESDFVMKLDADVILEVDYFAKLFEELPVTADVLGGVIIGNEREQSEYVPGPVKMYSREALVLVKKLPMATGLDVMDEMICRYNHMEVRIVKSAKFKMARSIGHSQGKLHGRFRNGLVCRWTGYSPIYFVFHVVRYIFRSPYFFGSIWMIVGFVTAGPGPYDKELRRYHGKIQRNRLIRILRSPASTLRDLYGT